MSGNYVDWYSEDDPAFGSIILIFGAGFLSSLFSDDPAALSTTHAVPLSTHTCTRLENNEEGEADDKITAICADDPEYRHFNDIKELPPYRLAEIRSFFEDCILLIVNNFIFCSLTC
ncbi:hypothetical protein QYE76_057345 [Lolium multiflorum]|uniref:inorganic diphosphatase n=1 Tax=Lolium multiflorum TaxID=4521 RepID=A0AAD8T4Q5_LOLMU|nr:hypothetical protein QYE76_057345 [Lolium multiflorum]